MPKPLTVWITINWKILKEMGIPDHLICLLRNLYAGQEGTVRTGHGTTDWFQIGKGVRQGCILLPCLFNLYAEYLMRNAGLEEAQAGIEIAGRNITSDMQMTPPLWQKVKRSHTSTCICHRCNMFSILNTLPSPSPYHPSGSSQCTSPKHPVSCIEPGLATCFIHDILHVPQQMNG